MTSVLGPEQRSIFEQGGYILVRGLFDPEEAQQLYDRINFEYPMDLGVPVFRELYSWAPFTKDQMSISVLPSWHRKLRS